MHDFSGYDTHVYPVGLYPALRAHLRRGAAFDVRNDDDDDFEYDGGGGGGGGGGGADRCSLAAAMSTGACDCDKSAIVGRGRREEIHKRRRFRRELQFNLMATFMW